MKALTPLTADSCRKPSGLRAALVVAFAASLIAIAFSPSASAQDTWVGNTDANWATAANWESENVPASGDSFVFGVAGTSGATLTDNLTTSAFTIAGITFNSGASAFVVSGSAFTLTTGITNSSTALQTINDAITLNTTDTFTTTTGGGDITLGGILNGTGGITTAGAGTLTLSGSGSSIGAILATSGTINNTGSLTATSLTGTTNAVITNSGTLTVTGFADIAHATAATFNQTGGTVNLTSATGGFGNGLNIAYQIGGSGTYNLSGGTLNVTAITELSAGGETTGNLNISGGTANMTGGIDKASSASGVGNLKLTGGTLNIGGAGITNSGGGGGTISFGAGTVGALSNWSSAQNITLTSTAGTTFNTTDANTSAADTITLSGIVSGTGGLNTTGSGTLALTGTNTYSGGSTIGGGTLQTGNAKALGTGAVTVSGGTLQVGNGTVNSLTGIGALTLNNAASVLDLKTNTGSISLVSNQNFTMTLGTLLLNNNSTTTGANVDQITLAGTGTYSLTGGTVDLSGFANSGVAGTYNIIGGSGLANGLTFVNGQAGFNYSIDNTGDLVVVAVPEPSTIALTVIFGAGMLLLFWRRHSWAHR